MPGTLPVVYKVFERVVDLYGFVSVDTNRYSVPERLVGKTVTVYKHYATVEVHYQRALVASPPPGGPAQCAQHFAWASQHTAARTACALAAGATAVRPVPRARRLCRRAHQTPPRPWRARLESTAALQRSYPAQPFLAALEQALKYGMFDLTRLENLVLRQVAGDFFALDGAAP